RGRRRRRRLLMGVVALPVIAVLALAGVLLARTLQYRGETMPGVRVLGVGVSGLDRKALERRISAIGAAWLSRPVTIRLGNRRLKVVAGHLLAVNAKVMADAALKTGQQTFSARVGSLLSPWSKRHDIAPVLRIRRVQAGKFLAHDLKRYGKAPVNARLTLSGVTPVVHAARPGTTPV